MKTNEDVQCIEADAEPKDTEIEVAQEVALEHRRDGNYRKEIEMKEAERMEADKKKRGVGAIPRWPYDDCVVGQLWNRLATRRSEGSVDESSRDCVEAALLVAATLTDTNVHLNRIANNVDPGYF